METPEFAAILVIIVVYGCWMLVNSLVLLFHFKNLTKSGSSTSFSIIIPFRNEGRHLINLCELILKSSQENELELILIDDHSENETATIILSRFQGNPKLKLISLPEDKTGKKQALQLGHQLASYPWRVHLDADVIISVHWLQNMGICLADKQPGIIAFPVFPLNQKALINKFESLEFLSLMTHTEAGFRMGIPTMANAAQMAVHHDAFYAVNGYQNDALSSGDDIFLLEKLRKQKKWILEFVFNPELIAQFEGHTKLCDFFNQRLRWVSKSRHYKNPILLLSASLVALANLAILFAMIIYLNKNDFSWICLIILKIGLDFIHLIPAAIRYHKFKLLPLQLLLSLLYPLYAVALLFTSFVYRPQWKGRRISV